MNFNKKWNVIPEKDFKDAIREVFDQVSDALTNTLGPYGTTTIIERHGEHHVTKDGFQVLKSIYYEDPVLNNFLMLLVRISAQLVYQVGDGSTSSIVAANEIIKQFEEHDAIIRQYRPQNLIDIISRCVEKISEKLYTNATKIDTGNGYEDIRKIAAVSTNGNDEIANMIVDIYNKTSNPTIEFCESKTAETTHTIIDGYVASSVYMDTIYATQDDGTCVIKNGVYMLMFDHRIDIDVYRNIIMAAVKVAHDNKKRLVVIAPTYDEILRNAIRAGARQQFEATGTSVDVYCTIPIFSKNTYTLYNDFAIICGAQLITEQIEEEFDISKIESYMGYVDHTEIDMKSTLVKGFSKRNDDMYQKIKFDAQLKYDTIREKYKNVGLADTELTEAKNRLSKLECSMGVIHVGGGTSLEKKAQLDLVEDAVRACESAYNYGYNVGGNLAIIYAITDIINDGDCTVEEVAIYNMIREAFRKVFAHVLENKFGDDTDKISHIIDDIEEQYEKTGTAAGYDLIDEVPSNEIINSCRTDIEILRAALSVIKLLVTSNQYISINVHE